MWNREQGMLSSNVMSFMKKMVTAENAPGGETAESSNTLSKLRQTLSSGLLTAQDKVTKFTPARQTVPVEPVIGSTPTEEKSEEPTPPHPKPQNKDPGRRVGTCRVCLKSFKPEDFFKVCFECQQKVCEDCASYSKLDPNQDESTWSCSICRRKRQSRTQPVITQDSTDSVLDVPVLEPLQRRHSDAKLGSSTNLGTITTGLGAGLGSSLAPPRSPELRRHSDVSPASLKEIEKVAGDRREELRWERELEWRNKKGISPGASRAQSPSSDLRQCVEIKSAKDDEEDEDLARQQKVTRARRKSRIGRQHSYDDEVKGSGAVGNASTGSEGVSLGLPGALPRRASAYDVFAEPPALLGQQLSPGRRASFKVAVKPEESGFDIPVVPQSDGLILNTEEDRRMRRRGSQLPDINNLRALQGVSPKPLAPLSAPTTVVNESVRRQPSCDGEAIKIVIDDVDCDTTFALRPGSKRRVILKRDSNDLAHRTRGFGMRVVGGKTSMNGRLFAYVVWTVPGGVAEKAGLQQGDKILEWCGVSLVDKSFEEVSAVMDRAGDTAELLVEHANDLRMCDLLDDPLLTATPPSRKNSNADALNLVLDPCDVVTLPDAELDKSPSSPTRRKLPKTPEQLAKKKDISGRVQIQVSYHDDGKLSAAVLAADDLALREDGQPPEAYAQLRLLPVTLDQSSVKTDVAEATPNPMWNATLEFNDVPGEDLMERTIEVILWDYQDGKDPNFLGECSVDLQKAFLDDRPVWYRLEDPKLRLGGKSPYVSPRGSLATEIANRLMRRNEFAVSRSFSDDRESETGTPEFNLLHPDHAWACASRRGSSQSEGHLESDAVYQLNQDISKSLPGSRRSSFQSQHHDSRDDETPIQVYVNRGRRRSSVVRQDPEELLKSLKASRGELGRQMSLTNAEKRIATSHRRASCMPISRKDSVPEVPLGNFSSPEDDDDPILNAAGVRLGPGQIKPRGHRGIIPHGEIKLGLLMSKGQLEVEVVSARNIAGIAKESLPDTYIKTYLKDNDRWLQKRKTRVVSHSAEPMFRQTLRYSACDITDRSLLVMLWERLKGFEHNQGLGGAELALNKLNLTTLTVGWYPLFPITTLGSGSNDSP